MDENIQNRIAELIAELSDCKDDERDSQNRILQVINLVGTLLGIFLGTLYFTKENIDDSKIRLLFVLSVLIFCAAYSYIITIGIQNFLRHYYIRNLEERIADLIKGTPDDEKRNFFLHWNAFFSPINTLNLKHISSIHTALYYCCYMLSIVFIILLSTGIVISIFMMLTSKTWYDYTIMIAMIIYLFIVFLFFLRSTVKADNVSQFAWDTAHKNGLRGKKMYQEAKFFRHKIKYFIYPRLNDLQKPLLLILGSIYAVILTKANVDLHLIYNIAFTVFVFDFLVYQARYQINDIRGIEEDKQANKSNRLFPIGYVGNKEMLIQQSFIIAVMRLILALILIITCGKELKWILSVSVIIVIISTILYEMSKVKGEQEIGDLWKKITLVLVGIGYPLRFLLGFLAVKAEYYSVIFTFQGLCFILAFALYGIFASIMVWTNEILDIKVQTENPQYKKSYFKVLDKEIEENDKKIFWSKKGVLKKPWNLTFMLSLTLLLVSVMVDIPLNRLMVLEVLFIVVLLIEIYSEKQMKKILFVLSLAIVILKVANGIFYYDMPIWYVGFSAMQFLIAATKYTLMYPFDWSDAWVKIHGVLKRIYYIIINKQF